MGFHGKKSGLKDIIRTITGTPIEVLNDTEYTYVITVASRMS